MQHFCHNHHEFIFTITALVIGWSLNQIGQWLKIKHDDKRVLKNVLFHILEIHSIFDRLNFSKYKALISEILKDKFPQFSDSQDIEIMEESLNHVFPNVMLPKLAVELKSIQESYNNLITDLASIEPLTAYYIHGRKNIIEAIDEITKVMTDIDESTSGENSNANYEYFIPFMKSTFLTDALKDLKKDIKRISWKIDPFTWLRTKKALKYFHLSENKKLRKELSSIIDTLLKGAKEINKTTSIQC